VNPDRAAVGSALLLAAAAPPSPVVVLVFIALVPLVRAVEALPPGAVGRRRAFRAGVVHGAVYWGVLLIWIPQVAFRVGLWAAIGYLAVVSTLALLAGLATLVLHRLRERGVALPLAVAVAWVGVEWLRTAWLGPLSFPWMGLALPLAGVPPLIQGAAWVGEIGVAFAVAAVNGFVVLSLRHPGSRPVRSWALTLVGLAVAFVGGSARMDRAETDPVLRALLIQPDVSLADKRAAPPAALRASIAAVEAVLPARGTGGYGAVDVAILPETAVPAVLDGDGVRAVRESVASWSRRLGVPLLLGAYGSGPGRGGNAVFMASADPAAEWPSAWKTRLVPGVEWTPWADDAVQRGRAPALLELPGGVLVAPLVCIESAGPQPSRAMVARGARVLVNVTNDAWLGERAWWSRSAAFAQHPAHLAFRAVEGGVGALRVGNNGRTESVDPVGRRTLIIPPFEAGLGRAEVVALRRPTFFVSWGPWIGTASWVLALASLLVPPRHARPLVDPPLTV
jgi:apolipoprotein N-acyltransferase